MKDTINSVLNIIDLIMQSKSILLSTHRQCDGDGLGAELAMYWALKSIQKKTICVNVDIPAKKYDFLNPQESLHYISDLDSNFFTNHAFDLALIFDTNDNRLIEPLYSQLQQYNIRVAFIDHHPALLQGPPPSSDSWIDVKCASTGEMAYKLIQNLNIPLNPQIARCLYTSIAFDTQVFRFVRNSAVSHEIAADLLKYDIHPDEIHRQLFGQNTIKKMAFLAQVLSQIEYHCNNQLAMLKLSTSELEHYSMEPDDSRDLIDILMNIENLQIAALFRQDGKDLYKMSLRSKGNVDVLPLAEFFGGGGHHHAAGALVQMPYTELRKKTVEHFTKALMFHKPQF